MINIEHLEFEQEENEQYIKKLEQAKTKLLEKGFIVEEDLPLEDREEWIKLNDNFFTEKLAIGNSLKQEYEDSISFYEFGKPIGYDDFTALPLTQEEQEKLDNLIEDKVEEWKFDDRGNN